ncbi:hypothetical protein GUJ93_ZPchr0010g9987 [Zizania palustris]|uniref:Uncharacterized protein n=1 Tax=Zizania palustris TaxID=103762 RepID=A0A8J5WG82_ZIZPA|nr:hypothetical protein GUJ93_ZPchr0010g9987 [Zizania palustris]
MELVGGGGGRRRGGSAPLLLLSLMMAASVAADAASMELYFSAAELARIAGYGEEPVSTVVVSGQVACELRLDPGPDLLTFDLPGAVVAVACETEGPNTKTKAKAAFATTDESGNFTIDLPSRLHATPSLENACSVEVLQLPPGSPCRRRSLQLPSSHGLRPSPSSSSSADGVRAYTTGVIRLHAAASTAPRTPASRSSARLCR